MNARRFVARPFTVEDSRQRPSWLRRTFLFAAVVTAAFSVYSSNPQTLASYDSAPNSLLVFNVLQNHRLDFDGFRRSYFVALGGQYAFVEAPNGHLTSVFPIGAALVTAPLYTAFYLIQRRSGDLPTIESPAFEPFRQRDEKLAAGIVAALSVGLFLLCSREIGNAKQAAIATLVYALATSMWSIGSQALWQHGPVNAFVLGMLYALMRADRARGPAAASSWLIAAGACAGLLPVIRPTAVLFSIAGAIFTGLTFQRRQCLSFAAALLIGAAPGIAWNAYFFHSLVGGYAASAAAYDTAPQAALVAFAGLLLSPSRGLFIFSPVLLFSLAGVANAMRRSGRNARLMLLLAGACAALVVQYAFYRYWWGGYAYGPRFLSDTVAVATLFLVYAMAEDPLAAARRRAGTSLAAAAFTLCFCFSVAVQFAGVNAGAAGSEWNAVPVSVDRQPARVWQLGDSQIERNLRAAYVRFFAWTIAATPRYDSAVAARVTSCSPSSTGAIARLTNTGAVPIYGYASGVYSGQMRVRVRIMERDARAGIREPDRGAAERRMPAEQDLYVAGSPSPGQPSLAIGTIAWPTPAGSYVLECTPFLVGGAALADPIAFRAVVHLPFPGGP